MPFDLRAVDAVNEIGALDEILKIQQRVCGVSDESRLRFRYAPSIIARSEAELFAISTGRFSVRVYLDGLTGGFINARRKVRLKSNLPAKWFKRTGKKAEQRAVIAGKVIHEFVPQTGPQALMNDASCVGDSLLKCPQEMRTEFRVLELELGTAYGEHTEIVGTPYMKHIITGGGLCAQAACFMGMVLRHADQNSDRHHVGAAVYGPGEVTWHSLAETEQCWLEMLLNGLSPTGVATFLQHFLGFSAWQIAEPPSRPKFQRKTNQRQFSDALRAYIRAGIPVILAVDLGRMGGRRLSRTRAQGPDQWAEIGRAPDYVLKSSDLAEEVEKASALDKEPQNHAVLVVGAASNDRFLINDPASVPFINTSGENLFEAAQYSEDAPIFPGTAEEGGGVQPEALQKHGMFIPVAPTRVRLPLLDWLDASPRSSHQLSNVYLGLWQMSMRLVDMAIDPAGRDMPFRLSPGASLATAPCFALLQLSQLDPAHFGDKDHPLHDCPELRKALNSLNLRDELGRMRMENNRWLWLELVALKDGADEQELLLVWDAEMHPCYTSDESTNLETIKSYLCYAKLIGKPATQVFCGCDLRPAVITSVCLKGFEHSLQAISLANKKKDELLVELYCFMDRDRLLAKYMKQILPDDYKDLPSGPAVRMMAMVEQHADCDRIIDEIAEAHHEAANRYGKVRIASLASFVPEIMQDPIGTQNIGQRAIRFLILFARALRRRDHPAKVIELVAGSRIRGVWPFTYAEAQSQDRPCGYAADQIHPEAAIEQLIGNLSPVANLAYNDGRDVVGLALELEPGPLYVIRDGKSLQRLCERLDERTDAVGKVLGLNLDIAHWNLAGIELKWLLSQDAKAIRQRVIHAHISDHGRGHFADCVPGTVGLGMEMTPLADYAAVFRPWIDLIKRAAAENGRYPRDPRFSGFISLELEACKDQEMLNDGIAAFLRFLG